MFLNPNSVVLRTESSLVRRTPIRVYKKYVDRLTSVLVNLSENYSRSIFLTFRISQISHEGCPITVFKKSLEPVQSRFYHNSSLTFLIGNKQAKLAGRQGKFNLNLQKTEAKLKTPKEIDTEDENPLSLLRFTGWINLYMHGKTQTREVRLGQVSVGKVRRGYVRSL